jgi:hypothetical protein
MGLLLAVPGLARRAVIVLDDANCASVRQAAWDFLAAFPQARLELGLPTAANGVPPWWNGLLVLSWDAARTTGHGHEELRARREHALLESLYLLQSFHLRREGTAVRVVPAGEPTRWADSRRAYQPSHHRARQRRSRITGSIRSPAPGWPAAQ